MQSYSIVGLDLSFTNTGVAIIKNNKITAHSVKTKKQDNDIQRCLEITDKIINLIGMPNLVAIEDTYTGLNRLTAKKLISLGAIVRAHLTQKGIPYIDVPPTKLKKHITGKGNASKQDVMDAVNKLTNLNIKDDNQADAIGLALYAKK